jgi:hypothetical protein
MTIAIVAHTPIVLPDNGSSAVSADELNNGFQDVTTTGAGVLLATAAGAITGLTNGIAGQVLMENSTPAPTWTTISGDATLGSSGALTLATSGASAGTYGDSSHTPQITVDAKGRITAVSNVSVTGGAAAILGDIEGLELVYTSSGVLTVKAGNLDINGTVRTLSVDTTFTSGTNKALDNSTVITFAATKRYDVYAYWNGSALVLALEDSAGSNYAEYDATLRYWKAHTIGAQARCIGFIWGSGAGTMFQFHMVSLGRIRVYQLDAVGPTGPLTIVSGATQGTNNTWTALTLTPYIGAMAQQWLVWASMGTASSLAAFFYLSQDGGTTTTERLSAFPGGAAFANTPVLRMPNPSGSWTYSAQSSANTTTIRLAGAVFRV